MVGTCAERDGGVQQQSVGDDVHLRVTRCITIQDAACAGDDAHATGRSGVHFLQRDVAKGRLQMDVALGGGCALCGRTLRHGDGIAGDDVNGFAVSTGAQGRVLQQVMAGVDGDVACAAGVSVQCDVAAATTGVEQQVTSGGDTRCSARSSVNRDAARCRNQIQVARCADRREVLLGIRSRGRRCPGTVHAVHRQAQRRHGHAVALTDEGAASAG